MFGDTKLAHNKVSGIFLVKICYSVTFSIATICNLGVYPHS